MGNKKPTLDYYGLSGDINAPEKEEYVAASLKEADMKVAEGTMKYYSADEIRSKLEEVLNENL